MVLVDTSVWIRSLAGRRPFTRQVGELLESDDVAGHELVYGELFIGDLGGRQKLLSAYNLIYRAQTVPHDEVVNFVKDRRLNGRGVGWIDVHLLASALVGGFELWTADPRFAAVAYEFGVAYRPSGLD